MRNVLVCALLALAASGPALAQLHKCIGPDGQARYSDRACPASDKPAAIVAPRIAPPTAKDAQAAEDRRRLANERTAEADSRQRAAAEDTTAGAIVAASSRVDQIKRENHDPARCQAALNRLATMRRIDPVGWRMNVSAMEMQQQARLYCGVR